ncbi:Sialic acid TRAP transporter permease protein SiaT [Pseudovibrio axinellae]|uniref:TRAP transporter large permease protein n=1 Tax=Pseudovibrio axinellae TaxID=989403 RepID=A0A165VSW8_9HYPH|nr:TRAP transporter large permease [Pseudovibrio axinellae]KZL15395.1 Sialic acid TRAP transporter permease protein SiaT [Pseudovibrio axinellae]SER54599.1 TRAP transporter, DctM subunit [Pseudovibrio axinellae]
MFESLVGFAALLTLIFLRVPIAFAMILVGSVGFAWIRGWSATWPVVSTVGFETSLSYSLSIVPLFILMGNLLTISGVSQGLYAAANRLLGGARGGLAMASVVACGGFSAVCGSSLATAATMSKVAMPSMRKYGYADSLASGSIAAGGTLGILIPPSVVMIIYGLLTESDIGKLFIAGVLPGILGLLLYIGAIYVATLINPSLAPKAEGVEPFTRKEKLGVFAVLGLFAVIMVGIYGGFFTPTEAAGIGAATAFLIALAMGGMKLESLYQAMLESARTTAMIFMIIIGAEVFSNFVNFAGLPDTLAEWVLNLDVNAYMVLLGIVLIYIVLGCVLESLSMILLTVPVFYPLILELDFGVDALNDPEAVLIWFAVIVVVVTEISLISPPVGLNVFVLRNVLQDVKLSTIFKGVFPFWVSDLVRLALLIAFPWFSLWLIGAM